MQLQGNECSYRLEVAPAQPALMAKPALFREPLTTVRIGLSRTDTPWFSVAAVLSESRLQRIISWLVAILDGQPFVRTLRLNGPYLLACLESDTTGPDAVYYRFNIVLLSDAVPSWWIWYEIKPYTLLITGSRSELQSVVEQLTDVAHQFSLKAQQSS